MPPDVAAAVAELGGGPLLYALVVAVCVVRLRRLPAGGAWRPLLVLAGAQLLESVATGPLSRTAPDGTPTTWSSGHVVTAVVGWGLLALLRLRLAAALPLALAAGAVVGWARVAAGDHHASDVAVALSYGALVLLVSARLPPVRPREAPLRAALPSVPWWHWALLVAAVLVAVVPPLAEPPDERFKDLLVYAGSGAEAGSGRDVYAYRTVFAMPFTYPPFAAVLAEPLSRVPLGLLQALWLAGSVALLVVVARTALAPVVRRLGLPLVVAGCLVTSPVRSHLRFGQVGLLLVALVAADVLARRGPRGAGTGLAAALKLTPTVVVAWLLAASPRHGWRAAAWAAGATLLGLALVWPSASSYVVDALWDSDRFGRNDIPGNQSVRGLLLRADAPSADLLWLVVVLVLVPVSVLGARHLSRRGDVLGALAVVGCCSVAVSPISWVHHLVWLLPAVAALVAWGRPLLGAAWWLALVVSLPSLGRDLPGAVGVVVTSAQGLTAVAGCLLLPLLARPAALERGGAGAPRAAASSRPARAR